MKKLYLALLCAMALSLTSCRSSKESAMNDLRSFTTEINQDGPSYSMNDWRKAAESYQKINKNLRKYNYSNEEMAEIGGLQGECAAAFTNALGNKVTGIASFLKGMYNSFKDSVDLNFNIGDLFKNITE